MFCFIIPLKSKKVSKKWELVCDLFERTLESIFNQTESDFRVIVVCNEIPKLKKKYDERLEFVTVNFSPTSNPGSPEFSWDKYKRLHVGMKRAGEIKTSFIMFVDADDLVHRHLVSYAHAHSNSNGWIIKNGYIYHYGSRWIILDNHFDYGTNAIIASRLIKFPRDLTENSFNECIRLTLGHPIIEKGMRDMGHPLKILPFRGAIYIAYHGENDSHFGQKNQRWNGIRFFLGSLRCKRILSNKIKHDFAIE